MILKLDFINETRTRVGKGRFVRLIRRFCETKGRAGFAGVVGVGEEGEIALILVGDKKIQKLNKEYRGFDKPTDVLSFAYLEDLDAVCGGKNILVGDIFISVDTSKRQAKEHGHSLDKELAILFTHGLLHVFGFDHKNDKEEKEMEKWAKKILS